MLSCVSAVISLEWSTGKMKLDAWPVEPPGFGSGPLSSSTRSRQPSRARWCTRLLPTMPAPITTARALPGRAPLSSLVVHGGHLGVGNAGEPDISHRKCTRPTNCEVDVRHRLGDRGGTLAGRVRGLLGAGPARGGRAPAVRRRGCERLDRATITASTTSSAPARTTSSSTPSTTSSTPADRSATTLASTSSRAARSRSWPTSRRRCSRR